MAYESHASFTGDKGKNRLRSVLGIGLGAVFLYFAMRDVDFDRVWDSIRSVNLVWVPLLTLLLFLDYLFRSLRWRRMFPPEAIPTYREAFDAFMIGALGNNLMPGRVGDLLRAMVIGRHLAAIGTSGALAGIVLEKILDGLVLVALLGIAIYLAPLPDWLLMAGFWGFAAFGGALAVLVAISTMGTSNRLSSGAGKRGLVAFLADFIQRLSFGLYPLRSKQRFVGLIVASLPIWVFEIGLLAVSFLTFNLDLPPEAALVTLVLLSLGTMLPAAPGFIGTYQFFIVTALSIYAVDQATAVALSVFLNVFVMLLTSIVGVMAIFLEGGLKDALKYERAPT